MIKRDSICPLCGGKMTVIELLDACEEYSSLELGLLSAHCPHCQGHLEVRPGDGRIDIGYTQGNTDPRFELATSLACDDLTVEVQKQPPVLSLHMAGRRWQFRVAD